MPNKKCFGDNENFADDCACKQRTKCIAEGIRRKCEDRYLDKIIGALAALKMKEGQCKKECNQCVEWRTLQKLTNTKWRNFNW